MQALRGDAKHGEGTLTQAWIPAAKATGYVSGEEIYQHTSVANRANDRLKRPQHSASQHRPHREKTEGGQGLRGGSGKDRRVAEDKKGTVAESGCKAAE